MNEQTRNLLEWLSGAPLRIFAVLLAAWVGRVVGARAITRAINKLATTDLKPGPGVAKRQAERARTTGSVLSSVGLGAQTLVRDILSGLFMLVEDQYGVGDEVSVLDIQGKVEKVGLRITTVRDDKGELWYIRNGEILVVGNKSQS